MLASTLSWVSHCCPIKIFPMEAMGESVVRAQSHNRIKGADCLPECNERNYLQ